MGQPREDPDGREEFWRWRRARELTEFIPAAPNVRKAMVRGWFTATLLGQVTMQEQQIRIFVPNSTGGDGRWRDFPAPLLSSGVHVAHDYLPLALESLPLAFIEVSISAELTAMAPYTRLRELGTGGSGGLEVYERPARELSDWVLDGRLPQGAPTPRAEHAGDAEGSWEVRRQEAGRSR